LENRECRDVFCCLLFIVNIGAMVYCSYYAYTEGKPSLVFRGTDPSNNICGMPDTATADYPYLYFTNPFSFNTSDRVYVTLFIQVCKVMSDLHQRHPASPELHSQLRHHRL
jgi:hypothetical protein